MIVSTMRRLAALLVVGSVGLIAGCQPNAAERIAAMTPVELDSAVASVAWTGCKTVARAAVGGGTTNVEICAAPGAQRYGPRNAPGWPGAPVARMRNGRLVEARWKLQPNGTYFIWLHSGTAGASYTIIGNGVKVTGTYYGCGHTAATIARASFGTCADNPHPMPSRTRNEGSSRGPAPDGADEKGGRTLLQEATGPAWISCTEGCCTTDRQ